MRKNNLSFNSSWRKDEHCTICTCPLITKTKALHSKCPLNPPKWNSVVTDSDSIEINNTIKDVEERTSQRIIETPSSTSEGEPFV
jgi:hypothetical protein